MSRPRSAGMSVEQRRVSHCWTVWKASRPITSPGDVSRGQRRAVTPAGGAQVGLEAQSFRDGVNPCHVSGIGHQGDIAPALPIGHLGNSDQARLRRGPRTQPPRHRREHRAWPSSPDLPRPR